MAAGTHSHDKPAIECACCFLLWCSPCATSNWLFLSRTGGAAQDEERWEGIIAASEAEAVRHAAVAVRSAGASNSSGLQIRPVLEGFQDDPAQHLASHFGCDFVTVPGVHVSVYILAMLRG